MEQLKKVLDSKFIKTYKKQLLLILIAVILMIITALTGTLELFGTTTYVFTFLGAIIFSFLLGSGFFLFLYKYLHSTYNIQRTSKSIKSLIIVIGKKLLIILFALILSLTSLLGAMIAYYGLRLPPSFDTDERLQLETYAAVPASGLPPGNGLEKHHKSNTKLYFWNNAFYLIYQNSKWHLEDKDGELVIARSLDGSDGSWERIASIKGPGRNDVRDPLMTEIKGTLFLYFLPNWRFDPGPNETWYCASSNGEEWTEPEETLVNVSYPDGWQLEDGWVFGRQRPLSLDNQTWYTMASGRKNGKRMTLLIETTDGINWKETSVVYDTYGSGEPCMEFLPSGEIICTLRVGAMSSWVGYEFGTPHAGTVIATSYNNLQNWSYAADFQTRMDGATIFTLKDRTRVFVAGRNHLGPRIDLGNHVSRKRTSIYELKSDKLIHLFDLPSNGDTAYTGVVIRGDDIYVSYYTNPINKDLPWIIGLCFLSETEIRMAKFSASGLIEYANEVND
ncbi:MAG: conserved membrane protein of unknown function [Promethearchaeota archaeon]|nr:MAG: conserved membrane protein of unknown function [Candidatus Lokiarchaeota archaeon]